MVADIYSPGGQLLTTVTAGCDGGSGGGGAVNLTLTISGTYIILVHNAGNLLTSSYTLSVQSVTSGGCNSQAISCGQTVATNTSVQSQMDAYSYAGSAGQVLSFSLWSSLSSCGNPMVVGIYSPGGQLLTTVTAGCESSGGGGAVNLTLTNSGVYTILVHNAGYLFTSSYALSVQSVTGGGCNPQTISCGETVATNTSFNSEIDAYGFGTGGGTVIFSYSGYSGARFDLYDPMGNKLFTATPGTAPITNLAAGTYTLLVHDSGYNHTGSYGFTVTCFPQCNYLISPTGVSVGASATNGTVTVSAGSGCPWTATNNESWLTITGGSSGSGTGTVSYAVAANCSASVRSGNVTILPAGATAGWNFIVYQAGQPNLIDTDIGVPGAPGSLGETNCLYTVRGSGQGIFTTGDVFNFAYLPMQGDGMIVARLAGMQPDNPQSEAGVMMRDGLSSGARHVFLGLDASTNMFLRRRLVANANSIQNAGPGTNVCWLRLTRIGNTFIGHVSTNGTTWNYAWATALVLPSQLDVGLAVTAHHYASNNIAEFDNLAIGATTPLPGAWPGTAPKMYLCLDVGTQATMQNLGGFPVLAGGVVGDQYSVKYSTNVAASLASWQSLGTVTNTWGVATFLDSQALTNKMRFYRLQRVGP